MDIIKWLNELFEHKEKVYCEECRYYSWEQKYYKGECLKTLKYKPSVYDRQGDGIKAHPEIQNMFNHCKYYEKGEDD